MADPFSQLLAIGKASGNSTGVPNFAPIIGASLQSPGGSKFTASDYYAALPSSNSASAQTSKDANLAGSYQDQINSLNNQNGRLDAQQNVGLSNIDNSYNSGINRLDAQKGQAQQNYNIQTQDNTSNYAKNRSAIISKTTNQANALQRLLGIAGSGNSSAAYEQAPYAAGLQGTQQLNDAQGAYATNGRNLDLSRDNFLAAYKTNKEDLDQQRYSQQQNLKSSITSTRAGLLDKLKTAGINRDLANGAGYATAARNQAGYDGQVNSLLDSITQLGNQYASPVLRTGDINFAVPSLNQYALGRGVSPITQGGTSSVDSAFNPLITQQRDQFGNIIG